MLGIVCDSYQYIYGSVSRPVSMSLSLGLLPWLCLQDCSIVLFVVSFLFCLPALGPSSLLSSYTEDDIALNTLIVHSLVPLGLYQACSKNIITHTSTRSYSTSGTPRTHSQNCSLFLTVYKNFPARPAMAASLSLVTRSAHSTSPSRDLVNFNCHPSTAPDFFFKLIVSTVDSWTMRNFHRLIGHC